MAWALGMVLAVPAWGQETPTPPTADTTPSQQTRQPWFPYEAGLQVTLIDQNLSRFHSPYSGPNSLPSQNENELSDTYTLYLGTRFLPWLEVFVNPEMARGRGIGNTLGLAGYTNGDVIRNPTLGQDPYLGRYFVRFTLATGHGTEDVPVGENQIAGKRPMHRLVLTMGKVSAGDFFDLNSYANSTRTQFMNWSLINNGAWDYAADTRGYTVGAALEWIHPDWALRIGSFQMPTVANGPDLAGDWIHNRGDQIEAEFHPKLLKSRDPLIIRALAYRNFAHMGSYDAALALAAKTGATPDITAIETPGAVKYGYGLNFEQALGDGGQTGIFGRLGWNNGTTESFAYTEVDRTFGAGLQVSGARWRRKQDYAAIALVQNDLSSAHKNYLAAGGLGFLLGDGTLSYAPERILETYYSFHVGPSVSLGPDYQLIVNPGYNSDRGPVSVVSFRLHLEL
jgi:hypothetical protein